MFYTYRTFQFGLATFSAQFQPVATDLGIGTVQGYTTLTPIGKGTVP